MVEFFTEDVQMPSIEEKNLVSWLSSTCVSEERVLNEVNVIFCSDDFLLQMNIEHLNHDYFTDIITFDYCFDNQVVGDLFISLDRVFDNAKDNNVLFYNELYRVLVHGVLHLCGYKDKTDDESKLMRSKENHYLSLYVSRET
jgi:probable rRNA maturation factor